MIKNFWQEIILSLALLIVVLFFLPPLQNWWMMPKVMPSVCLLLAIIFLFFATLIWKEQAVDERQILHRNLASRLSFITGSATLVLGIIIETWQHQFNPWLVIVLIVMIISKLITRVYFEIKG